MLQVTDSAVSELQQARDARQLPQSFGVRLFAQSDDDGRAAVTLAFAEEPDEGDEVTEQGGTRIYVAPELVEPLAGSRLDVEQTPRGPQLKLVPQREAE